MLNFQQKVLLIAEKFVFLQTNNLKCAYFYWKDCMHESDNK